MVLAGLMVGFLALTFSTPIVPQALVEQTQQLDDQNSDDQQSADVSVKAFDAITSSVQINFNHDFHLINILPDLEDQEEVNGAEDRIVLPGSKVLQVLFRRIISPNAP